MAFGWCPPCTGVYPACAAGKAAQTHRHRDTNRERQTRQRHTDNTKRDRGAKRYIDRQRYRQTRGQTETHMHTDSVCSMSTYSLQKVYAVVTGHVPYWAELLVRWARCNIHFAAQALQDNS